MPSHVHTCLHCPETATVEGPSPASMLPPGWRWWTRREEGLDAAACCPSCWDKKSPDRVLRRVGGPTSRASRRKTRG